LFIFSIVLSLLFLASVWEIVFKFEEKFNVGYFRTDKDYRTTYSDGYGELNMDLQLSRIRDDRYSYYLSCHFSLGNDVEIIGLKHINYTVNVRGSILSSPVLDWDPPTEQFSSGSSLIMNKGERLTWSGSAEVQFISNSIVQNETIEFILRLTLTLGSQDYYNIGLIAYVVLFFWIMAFPVVPIVLKAIIQPQFNVPLDEESIKRHKKYLDYFKQTEDDQD